MFDRLLPTSFKACEASNPSTAESFQTTDTGQAMHPKNERTATVALPVQVHLVVVKVHIVRTDQGS